MITVEQLNSKNYPQECWINCYDIDGKNQLGWKYNKAKAEKTADYVLARFGTKCIYRIHVRLK